MRAKEGSKKSQIDQIKTKNPHFLSKRAMIIDWIVGIHHQLKLFPQTLFIAVSYMDQFSSKSELLDN